MQSVLAMALKDIRLLFRDRAGMFFTFVFPIVFAVFFGMIFSSSDDQEKKIAIVTCDEDGTPGSSRFARSLLDADEFDARAVPNRADAERAVLTRQAAAYIILPKGFAEKQQQLFLGKGPELDVGVDPSRQAESGMLLGVLQKYAFMDMANAMTDPTQGRQRIQQTRALLGPGTDLGGLDRGAFGKFLTDLDQFLATVPEQTEPEKSEGSAQPKDSTERRKPLAGFSPITIHTQKVQPAKAGPTNSFAVTFPQGIIWGILGSAMGFGVSLVTERSRGTLSRLRMAPLPRWQVLGGKALACFITTVAVSTAMLLVAMLPPFNVRFAEPVSLAAAVVSSCIAFVGLMMLVAAIGRTESAVSGIGWGTMMVLSMIGGAMVPLFAMPGWMQQISSFSPMKWTVVALEGGVWRGYGLADMLLPCGILLAIGVIGFAFGAFRFERQAG